MSATARASRGQATIIRWSDYKWAQIGPIPNFYSSVGVIRICGLFLGVSTRGEVKAQVMSNQAQVDALEHLFSIIKSNEVSIAAYETFENAQAITDG